MISEKRTVLLWKHCSMNSNSFMISCTLFVSSKARGWSKLLCFPLIKMGRDKAAYVSNCITYNPSLSHWERGAHSCEILSQEVSRILMAFGALRLLAQRMHNSTHTQDTAESAVCMRLQNWSCPRAIQILELCSSSGSSCHCKWRSVKVQHKTEGCLSNIAVWTDKTPEDSIREVLVQWLVSFNSKYKPSFQWL